LNNEPVPKNFATKDQFKLGTREEENEEVRNGTAVTKARVATDLNFKVKESGQTKTQALEGKNKLAKLKTGIKLKAKEIKDNFSRKWLGDDSKSIRFASDRE
jgi:hypothetical protein